ncbi:ZIP family zinc transporter [Chromohalobacter marismortui]|uniref:ZIP family zinc transporter n=1 Tax=Chromohalobacter marismortui TaxID=42055 RepID=A0A4R7NNU2_9GAMM|nr:MULTISPECIES: ZIP family metal transporter [Chromohalobacter]MCI0509519.1 ZIP family metal transporter [Chromohalobacter sp.]MCI0592587.1 ZIP family metal transporter [Chromohalobacter sp.]TDU22239.1 ZIP family zinc transporter [Chromohalobacter marismortui]
MQETHAPSQAPSVTTGGFIRRRWALGILLAAAVSAFLIWWLGAQMRDWLGTLSTLQAGMLASLVAGLFTPVGALPIMVLRHISQRLEDALMGFGAGVMLAATAYSLAMPAYEDSLALTGTIGWALTIVCGGIVCGGILVWGMDRFVPHEHFALGKQSGADALQIRRIWLFIFAITIHNFPEGLAVGVGYARGDMAAGIALTLGIGLQNLPEGLIVSLGLLAIGYSRLTALGAAFLSGLVEPVGGVIGAFAVHIVDALLPFGLAFAAGAMLFVISHEIIPESHRKGHEGDATFGVLGGFMLMFVLDKVF